MTTAPLTTPDWNTLASEFARALGGTARQVLAHHLQMPEPALAGLANIGTTIDAGERCWTFPERDGDLNVIGLLRRFANGDKRSWPGGRRGLSVPCRWPDGSGPVLIVEGASDVLALDWLQLRVVGRPSNSGGVDELATLLRNLPASEPIIVLGENDIKPDGRWPGQDGAKHVASHLQARLGRPVQWSLPPHGSKDARAWFIAHQGEGEGEGTPAELGQRLLALFETEPAPTLPSPQRLSPAVRGAEQEPEREPVVQRFAGLQSKPLEWLWPGWIARGVLTLLDGDPGLGKSTLLADIAARLTRGLPMPLAGTQGSGTQGSGNEVGARASGPGCQQHGVLLLSAEDDPCRVLLPRLQAAGADLTRVFSLEAVRVGDQRLPPVVPPDLVALKEMIRKEQIALIIIDPFMAYLAGGIDANRDQDIRRALHQLKELAEATGCAIVIVRHLNKSSGMQALYRGGGSIGIIGASRAALLVGKDPEDMTIRVLAMNKCNLALPPQSLRFRLESCEQSSRIVWLDTCSLTAQEVLKGPATDDEPPSQVEACVNFIRDMLAAGPVRVSEVQNSCLEVGYSNATVKRARKRLQLKMAKELGTFGPWVMGLAKS